MAVDGFFLNPTNFARSFRRPGPADPVEALRPQHGRTLYYLCLGLLFANRRVQGSAGGSRAGRVILASRDNPRAAAAMAVPTTRIKLLSFVVSGAIAGVAGGLHASSCRARLRHLPAVESLLVFSMVVIGGSGRSAARSSAWSRSSSPSTCSRSTSF